MFNPHKLLIVFLALVSLSVTVSADPVVYALANSQGFGTMDLVTGSFSPIGPVPDTIQYLAPGQNGSLLTMSFNGDLDSINPRTGATSVIGATGFTDCSTPLTPTCGPNSQLSFGSAGGTLYATDFVNNLYTVNPVTGKATLIGATGLPAVPFIPASTSPDGSFNFYNENLFGLDGKLYANFDAGSFNPATSAFTTVISPALYQLDTSTGQASRIGSTEFGLITVANVNGTIYGFNANTGQIVTLNVNTGGTSFVSDIDARAGLIGGAAAIPEPGSIALLTVGIAVFGVWNSRRRRSLQN